MARPFLLRDETLLAIAKRDALDPADAKALPGFDARRHAHLVPRWASALQAARAEVEAGTAPPEDPRTPADVRDRQDALGVRVAALVTQKATELGLPGEQLLSRRQRERAIEAWLRTGGSLAAALGGFRGAVLGAELDALTIDGDGVARRELHAAGRGPPRTSCRTLAGTWRSQPPPPVPEVAIVARHGKAVVPLLMALLSDDPHAERDRERWKVQQQVSLALCAIYSESQHCGRTYCDGDPPERIGHVRTGWLNVIASDKEMRALSSRELLDRFKIETVFWRQFDIAKALAAANDRGAIAELEVWLTHDDRHLRGNAAPLCHRRRASGAGPAAHPEVSRMIPASVPLRCSRRDRRHARGVGAGSGRRSSVGRAAPAAPRRLVLAPACAATPQDAWTLAQQAVATGDAGLVTERLSPDYRARNALEMAIGASMLAEIGEMSGSGSGSPEKAAAARAAETETQGRARHPAAQVQGADDEGDRDAVHDEAERPGDAGEVRGGRSRRPGPRDGDVLHQGGEGGRGRWRQRRASAELAELVVGYGDLKVPAAGMKVTGDTATLPSGKVTMRFKKIGGCWVIDGRD